MKGPIEPFAVMCCGCRRFLGPTGRSVDISEDVNAGIFSWQTVATFADKPAADKAAAKAGWQFEKDSQSNHRCPSCLDSEKLLAGSTGQRKGSFVPLSEICA